MICHPRNLAGQAIFESKMSPNQSQVNQLTQHYHAGLLIFDSSGAFSVRTEQPCPKSPLCLKGDQQLANEVEVVPQRGQRPFAQIEN